MLPAAEVRVEVAIGGGTDGTDGMGGENGLPAVPAVDGETPAPATATISLSSNVYTRQVFIDIAGIAAPLSDNFFDIEPGEEVRVTVPIPEGLSADEVASCVKVRSMVDVKYDGTLASGKRSRLLFRMKPFNLVSWIIFKFI
jgi:hypothetical protein